MPQHQLELAVAITLSILAAFSGLLLCFLGSKDGGIKLTDEGDASNLVDVTTPQDVVDGEPIEASRFWRNVFCGLLYF